MNRQGMVGKLFVMETINDGRKHAGEDEEDEVVYRYYSGYTAEV